MRAWVPSKKTVRTLASLAVLTAVAVLGYLIWQVATLSVEAGRAKTSETVASAQRNQMSSELAKQGQAIAEANRRLRAAGKPQVSVPAIAPIVPDSAIARAVAAYLALNPPKAGTNAPTLAQIVAEVTPSVQADVASYLAAHPAPTGPAGKPGPAGTPGAAGHNGTNGTNGANGVNGANAPAPTDAQVSAAVASYCDAHDHCQGPPGATGATGAQGNPGTSAVPFTFIFTVQDNPVQSTTYTCTVTAPNTTATCTKD